MNPMNSTLTLEEIYEPIREPIQTIPGLIDEIVMTPNVFAREVIEYFFSGRGKLLRPALTLLGAELVNAQRDHTPSRREDSDSLLRLAAAFEIFHSATLIHDDIIDCADLRRNLPTLNAKWGPQTAVLVGDYLHDKAMVAIFNNGHDKILSRFLDIAGTVCDGEILEINQKYNFGLTEEDYYEIIGKKTASFLSCCAEAGAVFSQGREEWGRALSRYGYYFGMAFQILDDCLDFMGKKHEFGKTLGADLAAGVLTLPPIRLLKIVESEEKREIIAAFKSKAGSLKFLTVLEKIREYDTIHYSLEKAREFSAKARRELDLFADCPARQSLEGLLDYVLERNR